LLDGLLGGFGEASNQLNHPLDDATDCHLFVVSELNSYTKNDYD